MKSQLNEVQKLQKLAGIVKENINEAPLTINQVVKQLNKIANSKGFYAVDKSKDQKPTKSASGVKNLVKWKDDEDNIVELYHNKSGADVTIDDLEIHFESDKSSGEEAVEDWLDPEKWDYEFSSEEDESNLNEEDTIEENSGQSKAVNIVQSAISSGEHINSVSYEEYLLPLAKYLDTYGEPTMGDLEFSPNTFAAFSNLVDSMNKDMEESAKNY